jgi:hypothetical protein
MNAMFEQCGAFQIHSGAVLRSVAFDGHDVTSIWLESVRISRQLSNIAVIASREGALHKLERRRIQMQVVVEAAQENRQYSATEEGHEGGAVLRIANLQLW